MNSVKREYPEATYLRNLADRFESPRDADTLRNCASHIDLLHRDLDQTHTLLNIERGEVERHKTRMARVVELERALSDAQKKLLLEPWDLVESLKKDREAALNQWKAARAEAKKSADYAEALRSLVDRAVAVLAAHAPPDGPSQQNTLSALYSIFDNPECCALLAKNSSQEHCGCPACKDGTLHKSDCAVHNMPAYPNGPCDCGAIQPNDISTTKE